VKSLTLVTLDGSNSHDPDNNLPLTYGRQQISGEAAIMSNPVINHPTFTAPGVVTQPQTLTFALVVTNRQGTANAPAEVNISVEPCHC
jgi:hypothetical protein